jgi:preprotein translocase subunit SecD
MTNRCRCLLAVAACLLAVALLGACGGDDSPSPTPSSVKGRAILQIAGASPVASDISTAVQTVLKNRLDSAGVQSTIAAAGAAQLRIDFDGPHSVNFITDLVVTPGIRFKKPILDGTAIKCKDTSGGEFSIEPELLQLSGNLPLCVSADNRRGEVEWQPAVAQVAGAEKELTGAMLIQTQVALPTNENGEPMLNADFNDEGKVVLQAVTKDLVGYPLGVFLGDSLLLAGKIQREIQNGRITLAGASLDVMEELRAVIRGGELPADVTLVSIEQQ